MIGTRIAVVFALLAGAACKPAEAPTAREHPPSVGRNQAEKVDARDAATTPNSENFLPAPPRLAELDHLQPDSTTVCGRFVRRVAEQARQSPTDAHAFLRGLQREFVAGTDDPFELERGLREGRWNQEFVYAGGGGFRADIDDAERYPRGENHQPGHFVSVVSVAARFGEENARLAIAQAGDYQPGEEEDLRLSETAIVMGTGLADGTLSPVDVALRVGALCK